MADNENLTRDEYLRALLNNKRAIDNQGGALVNPTVQQPDKEDLSVGSQPIQSDITQMSAIQQVEQAGYQLPKAEDNRNGWQRFWDSVRDFNNNLLKGFADYVIDPIVDGAAYLYGAISGDQEGAKAAMDTDWQSSFVTFSELYGPLGAIATGDFFTKEYWTKWGNMESSTKELNRIQGNSFVSEFDDDTRLKILQAEEIGGSLLPDIFLAIATGGASVGAKAGLLAGRTAIAGAQGFGAGVNEALKDGAEYEKAGYYGLARGGTNALLTFAGGKIAGQLLGGGVGSKVGNAVFGKTGSVVLSKALQIATNAGISGATRFVDEALAKPVEKLAYDSEAWAKAYGEDSKTYNTLMNAGKAGLTAVALSALSQSLTEGGKLLVEGKQEYVNNVVKEYEYSNKSSKAIVKKIAEKTDELLTLNKQLEAQYNDLKANGITEETYNLKVKPILDKFNTIKNEVSALYDDYTVADITTKVGQKYAGQLSSVRTERVSSIVNSFTQSGALKNEQASWFLTKAFDKGYSFSDVKDAMVRGSESFSVKNGVPMISFEGNNVSLPLQITNEKTIAVPNTAQQKVLSLTYLADRNSLVDSIELKTSDFLKNNVDLPVKTDNLVISKDTAKRIVDNYTADKIKEFFDLVKSNKGKTVIEDGNRYIIVSHDGDNTLVTYVDSKFQNITDMKYMESGQVKPNKIARTSVAMAKVSEEIVENNYNNENKYVKAYAELNHEKVLSMKKSKDIVDIARKQIFDKLVKKDGYTYKLDLPKEATAQEIFTAVNTLSNKVNDLGVVVGKDYDNAIESIAEEIAASKVIATSPSGVTMESVAGHKEDLIKAIKGLVNAKSELSKIAKLEKRYDLTVAKKNAQIQAIRDRANAKIEEAVNIFRMIRKDLQLQIKEAKDTGHQALVYRRNKMTIPAHIKNATNGITFSKDNVAYNQVSLMLKPIANLHSNGSNSYYQGNLKEDIKELLNIYNEENFKKQFEDSPVYYDENIRAQYEKLLDMLPDRETYINKNGETAFRNRSLTASELKEINTLLKMISTTTEKEIVEYKESIEPVIRETLDEIMSNKSKAPNPFSLTVGAKYRNVKKITGYTTLSNEATNNIRIAKSNAKKFSGGKNKIISEEIINKKLNGDLHKKIEFYGKKVPTSELLHLYEQLLIPEKFEEIDSYGVRGEVKGKYIKDIAERTKGHAQDILDMLEQKLPQNVKDFGNFLIEQYNGATKETYAQWYINRYKVAQANIQDTYIPSPRDVHRVASVESMVKTPKIFGSSISRVKNTNPYKIVDSIRTIEQYNNDLGDQLEYMPQYRKVVKLFNIKIDYNGRKMSVMDAISEKYGTKVESYIQQYLKEIGGIVENRHGDLLSFVYRGIYKATLGFRGGTMWVQGQSRKLSNLSIPQLLKAEWTLLFGGKEYRKMVDDVVEEIGNYLYRTNGTDKIKFDSANTVMSNIDKVTDLGMKGIAWKDRRTLKLGVTSAINSAIANGYQIGTEEFTNAVLDYYTEFDLTQINSDPLGSNQLKGTIFDIFQGPYRVAYSSVMNKIDLLKKFFKFNDERIKTDLDNANAKLETAKANVEEKNKMLDETSDALNELLERRNSGEDIDDEEIEEAKANAEQAEKEAEQAEKDYGQAKTNKTKADSNKREYERYKKAGGKGILFNLAGNLISMAIGTALIKELDSFLRGKKDIRAYGVEDLKQLGLTMAENAAFSWIPMINSLTNALFNGYSVTLPSYEAINEVIDTMTMIADAIKEGGLSESGQKTLIRQVINIVSNMTGAPIKNIYQYIYGITKLFNPEMAIKMNSLFYTTSSQGLTKSYNAMVSKGAEEAAIPYLDYLMTNYKAQPSNENINKELYYLSSQGYNALPKSVPSQYNNADGIAINLSSAQISQFSKTYSQASKVMTTLMGLTEYKTLTAEEKSKAVKSLYDYYFDFAKVKTFDSTASSKFVNILSLTNGNIDMAKYIVYLQNVSKITENKQKTRKELVIEYINRLSTLSKAEKTLLMYLAGYSVKDNSQTILISLLTRNGVSYKDAKKLFE